MPAARCASSRRPGDRVIARKAHIAYHGGVRPARLPVRRQRSPQLAALRAANRRRAGSTSRGPRPRRGPSSTTCSTPRPWSRASRCAARHPPAPGGAVRDRPRVRARPPPGWRTTRSRRWHCCAAGSRWSGRIPRSSRGSERCAWMLRRCPEARDALEQALLLDPRDLQSSVLLGSDLRGAGRLRRRDAGRSRHALADRSPTRPRRAWAYGLAAYMAGRNDDAAAAWRPVIDVTSEPRILDAMVRAVRFGRRRAGFAAGQRPSRDAPPEVIPMPTLRALRLRRARRHAVAIAGCAPRAGHRLRAASPGASRPPSTSTTLALWQLRREHRAHVRRLGRGAPGRRAGLDTRTEFGRFRNARQFTPSIESFALVRGDRSARARRDVDGRGLDPAERLRRRRVQRDRRALDGAGQRAELDARPHRARPHGRDEHGHPAGPVHPADPAPGGGAAGVRVPAAGGGRAAGAAVDPRRSSATAGRTWPSRATVTSCACTSTAVSTPSSPRARVRDVDTPLVIGNLIDPRWLTDSQGTLRVSRRLASLPVLRVRGLDRRTPHLGKRARAGGPLSSAGICRVARRDAPLRLPRRHA